MTIQDGFGGEKTEIKIHISAAGKIECWIINPRLYREETLHYMTIEECLHLFNEVKMAGIAMFNS